MSKKVQEIIDDFLFRRASEDLNTIEFRQEALSKIKTAYFKQIELMNIDEDSDKVFFSWFNNPLEIVLLVVPNRNSRAMDAILAFASKTDSNTDSLIFKNLTSLIKDYTFWQLNDKQQVSFLIKKNLIDYRPEQIITPSITDLSNLESIAETWAEKEFKAASSHFKITPIETLNFNNIGLHADKYAFKIITDEIANDQFSVELDECLTAFEHELYYVCASGFGGILESILYFSLINYGLTGRGFPNDPTASNFITTLKSNELIDQRQESYIKSIFMIRNSVSHHNSGFTNVSQCQTMMLGVKNLFTNIYQPSQAWHQAHPGLSYKEYLKSH